MTIAITRATGLLGRLVVAKLKVKVPAGEIVALARDLARAADLGVTVRTADYLKPETLASASEIGGRTAPHCTATSSRLRRRQA